MPVISPVSVSFTVSHWTADERSATGPDVRSSNGDKIAHVFLVNEVLLLRPRWRCVSNGPHMKSTDRMPPALRIPFYSPYAIDR